MRFSYLSLSKSIVQLYLSTAESLLTEKQMFNEKASVDYFKYF